MVTYCYSTDDERVIEFCAPMGRAPQSVFSGGRMAHRDLAAEHSGQRSGDPWVNHTSMALACHPADKKKFEAEASGRGVPTTFVIQGDMAMPKFDSRSHQKRYCRAYGFANYGDT